MKEPATKNKNGEKLEEINAKSSVRVCVCVIM